MRQGEVAGDGDEGVRVLVGPRQRDRAEQGLGIGVAHPVEHLGHVARLHRFAGIHHAQPVADIEDQAEVVADEQDRGAVLVPQILHQIDDPRLHRHVERGGGLIKDQERGLRHQRHGDHDALLLAARKLVRIGPEDAVGVGQAHVGHDLAGELPGFVLGHAFVDHRHFGKLRADPHGGVQAGHRFLVDHGDFRTADLAQFLVVHGGQVAALEPDRPAGDPSVLAEVAHDGQRHGGFAAARLAHQTHRLARHHGAGEVHHRRNLAQAREEADREVLDLEDGFRWVPGCGGGHGLPRVLGWPEDRGFHTPGPPWDICKQKKMGGGAISPSGFLRAGRRPAGSGRAPGSSAPAQARWPDGRRSRAGGGRR